MFYAFGIFNSPIYLDLLSHNNLWGYFLAVEPFTRHHPEREKTPIFSVFMASMAFYTPCLNRLQKRLFGE